MLGGLVLILGALEVRRRVALRGDLARVAPELRTPLLPYLTVTFGARTLPLVRRIMRLPRPPGPGVVVTPRSIPADPPVPVLVVAPDEVAASAPALLWIHGGGMIVGSPELEAETAGTLARELGAVVVSPDYRLAPEDPFPAGLDDCLATLRWMREHADELGLDPDRVAVGGISAGGGLAAAVAQHGLDHGVPLRAQALVYPMLDDRTVLRTDHAGRGRFVWTPAINRFAWTAYLGRAPRRSDAPPYAAPVRRSDLAGLPPARVGVGDLDLFYDEDVAYAEQLRVCSVPCDLVTVPGMYHAADGFVADAPSMQDFRSSMVDHLRRHLAPTG